MPSMSRAMSSILRSLWMMSKIKANRIREIEGLSRGKTVMDTHYCAEIKTLCLGGVSFTVEATALCVHSTRAVTQFEHG